MSAPGPGRGSPVGQPRLYGNWRAQRGWGIGSLSTTQTVTLFVAVLAPVLAASVAPRAALVLAGVSVVVAGLLVIRVGGTTAAEILTRRVRFHRARAAGWTELSGGVFTDHPRGADLPGVLAPLVALDVEDGRGGRHALLWNRRTGALSVILRCSPVGLDLADPVQADLWVAGWGGLLADLGYNPLVRHLAVTVDTAPTGGTTVGDYVAAHLDPRAPALARTVLGELVAITPATAADIDARITLTLDPHRAAPRPVDLLAAVTAVARQLPGVETALGGCGIALLGRASTGWVTGRIRAAFDPAARPDIARLDHSRNDRAQLLGLGGRRAGRRRGGLGDLPARLGGLGVLGVARGAAAGRGRPGAGPAARARPVPAAGDLAV